jgi:hypothetical protein
LLCVPAFLCRLFAERSNPIAHAVRGHWRLDVLFDEDASRIRKDHAPAIMTTISHLAINLFEQDASKLRLSQNRRKTAWNDDYRAKILFGK